MNGFLIAMIIALAALVVFFVIMNLRAKKRQDIPRLETEGVLEKITGVRGRDTDPTFYIRYKVLGKEYLAMLSVNGAKGVPYDAPIGTKVTVLYNPDNPQDAYCEMR